MNNEEIDSNRNEPAHEKCNSRVAELEAKLKDKENKYLYLYADFENFKKRINQERINWFKFGWEPLATQLLEVMDNIERAIEHAAHDVSPSLKDGLNMTLKQLKAVLEKEGVKRLQTIQQSFDPEFHESVGKENSDQPAGIVIREEAPGYTLHGRLLRPARVVISSGVKNETKQSKSETKQSAA